MKRRIILHFFEQEKPAKRQKIALPDRYTSLSRRVEANSQYRDYYTQGADKFIKKGRS